jgi:hypothetical protein
MSDSAINKNSSCALMLHSTRTFSVPEQIIPTSLSCAGRDKFTCSAYYTNHREVTSWPSSGKSGSPPSFFSSANQPRSFISQELQITSFARPALPLIQTRTLALMALSQSLRRGGGISPLLRCCSTVTRILNDAVQYRTNWKRDRQKKNKDWIWAAAVTEISPKTEGMLYLFSFTGRAKSL